MGNRCQWAALGATFALSVAACAAPDTTTEQAQTPEQSAPSLGAPDVDSAIPEALADASFVELVEHPATCASDQSAQVALLDPATGAQRWAFPIPRPAEISATDGSRAFVSLAWLRDQRPGIAAVDLHERAPLWQRQLDNEAQQLKVVSSGLLVATHDDVRSIDPETGDDRWVLDSQFDFESVVLTEEFVFAIDSVGAHAIDTASGQILWQLELLRPDSLAADDQTLVVASGTRMVGVDIERRVRLWDIEVDRRGSGAIAISPVAAIFELSTTVAPGGGVAAIDRNNGEELWRRTNIGDPVLVGSSQLVASTANDEPAPAPPFVVFGIDVASGARSWELPATTAAHRSVLGSTETRLAISDPHPAAPATQRVRLIDLAAGELIWELALGAAVSGAEIGLGDTVTLFGTDSLSLDRGVVVSGGVQRDAWQTRLPEGVVQSPTATPHGLFVIAGERAPFCVGRAVREPQEKTSVLGTSTDQ